MNKRYINKYQIIIYFFVLSALYSSIGYHFGTDDQIEHFVSIFRIMDSNYLSNDYFVNANSGFGPRFYYSNLMTILSHIIPLTLIFFTLTFLSNFLIISVTYIFCKSLFRRKDFSCLLIPVFMMFFTKFNLGGSGRIWDTYLTPTSLSIPFILITIYELFIKNNQLKANIFLIISILIHPLLSIYGWVISFGSLFIYNLFIKKNIKPINILYLIFSPVLFIALWIIPKLIFVKDSIPTNEFIDIYAYFRLPHHLIPSQFPLISYIKYIMLFLALALLIYIYYKYKLFKDNYINIRLFHLSLISMSILIMLCIIGFIFTEVIPIKLLIIMQPFKSNSLFNWFLLLTILSLVIRLRYTNIKRRNLIIIMILLLLIVISLPYSGRYAIFPFILFIPFFWILYFKRKIINTYFPIIFTFAFLLFFLCGNNQIATKMRNIAHTIPTLNESVDNDKLELISYVKQNTDINSIFLTPPDWGAFRYCAKRAIVVDIKVGSFNELEMKEWKERIDNCYGPISMYGDYFGKTLEQMKNNYDRINFDKLKILNEKYHFNYVVLPINSLIIKNVIFKDTKYKIIQIL